MRLVFKVVVLVVMIFIGLTLSPANRRFLAGSAMASADGTCDLQSCMTKCVKLGYLGGSCGTITHTCVCYIPPPPVD